MSELKAGKYQAYPEYKDSGYHSLGLVPKHWVVCKLKHIKSETTNAFVDGPFGSNLKSEHFVDSGDVYVIESNFATTGKLDTTNLKTISESHFNTICRSETKEGAIIIAKIGARYGMSSILPEINKKAVVSGNSLSLQINKSKMDLNFCHNVLTHQKIEGAMDDGVNVTAQPALSLGQLNNLPFVNPPLIEQQKIANFLDHETAKIDTLIEKQQQLIKLLKEKRQAVISHAVTKGLNPNAPMKDSGVEWLGEVPAHWEVKKLKYIVTEPLLYGANEAAEDIDKSQPRFVRITDVDADGMLRDDTFRSLPQEIALPYMLKDGDILLARSGGTVGKSFIYRNSWGSCCFAGYLIKASINEDIIDADWVYFNTLTNFYWDWIKSSQIQATIQNVSADKYNNFEIAIPSKDESREIIDFLFKSLKRFDDLTLKSESAIKLMQERKTALISAAVTGKIDVSNWEQPND